MLCNIPPVHSELQLGQFMIGWQQSGEFRHAVKAEEPVSQSNKACLKAKRRSVKNIWRLLCISYLRIFLKHMYDINSH